jgi:acetate kinase
MKILVINSGSSTLKYKLFEQKESLTMLCGATLKHVGNFDETFGRVFENLKNEGFIQSIDEIDAYGHRVVHGGEHFSGAVVVDSDVLKAIDSLCSLAPLHNPANLEGIKKAMRISSNKPQVAVFDTAFHQTMPQKSFLYPIPKEHYFLNKIRRYGFHGSSHEYVGKKAAKLLKKDFDASNLITVHLGNGASICAIQKGKSIDTTMGFTPLEGLMMGTRSGDIDPSIIFELYKKKKSVAQIEKMLNLHSGLYAVCGQSDFQAISKQIAQNDTDAILAKDMFCHRVKKYIGAYKELLETVDAVVFTGGIGENSALIRQECINGVDARKNSDSSACEIQKEGWAHKIMVIATNEELLIAQKTLSLIDYENTHLNK